MDGAQGSANLVKNEEEAADKLLGRCVLHLKRETCRVSSSQAQAG